MLRRALAASRFMMIIAVVGALIGAFALLMYAVIVVVQVVVDIFEARAFSASKLKILAIGLIEAVDVFLIAVTSYMIGLGLYALFIDDSLPLPSWLKIDNLEDLKHYLVSLVIAVLAVLFLRHAMAWESGYDLVGLGGAIALVIVALTVFLVRGGSHK